MNKTKYPSLTNYLAKTKKNADLYRLYNPQFSFFCKSDTQEQRFYFDYFSRHMVSKRNILTVSLSIHSPLITWTKKRQ